MSKIYSFIGQPGAGKTTLAKHLIECLYSDKYCNYPILDDIIHIDGDDIRDIFKNKDYSENGRRVNIQKAYDIATFLKAKDYTVVISLVSPYLDLRENFKNNSAVVEIYVHTSEIRGRENYHVDNFQKPLINFIDIDTTNTSKKSSIKTILKSLNKNG